MKFLTEYNPTTKTVFIMDETGKDIGSINVSNLSKETFDKILVELSNAFLILAFERAAKGS